jgi:predicted DCC family thiol-disulfide oxidoreductase YuxK
LWLCRRAILGLARADTGAELRFCALGSPRGRHILSALGESETDRFMLVTGHGVLKDADAYVGILRRLRRELPARLLEAVPRPLRRVGYGLVARNRWLLSRLISAPGDDVRAITDWAAYERRSGRGRVSAELDEPLRR